MDRIELEPSEKKGSENCNIFGLMPRGNLKTTVQGLKNRSKCDWVFKVYK